jgi:cytoskeletal protein RodZ
LESVGQSLRKKRESMAMSLAEVSRVTRIPSSTLESLERDQFDDLPGEVFVRGFLRSFANAVRMPPSEILARYTQSRRTSIAAPVPVATSPVRATNHGNRRFGVAIACVLLLILFTLAVSIVLRPRGRDIPHELSLRENSTESYERTAETKTPRAV